jgi:hypothetical protein
MNTNLSIDQRIHLEGPLYALHRGADSWEATFEGRQSSFRHELGALYVAYLLSEPPRKPIHAVALALKAREKLGQPPSPAEALQQREMGLEDASSIRALWHRQRELERVLADRLEIEPVKAEALGELEQLTERLRQSPWLSCHGAERCAHAVAEAIRRFHARLAAAVDAEGQPDEVLRAFALHLRECLLVPSGRGGSYARKQAEAPPGCFIYVPPPDLVWNAGDAALQAPPSAVQGSGFKVQGSTVQRPAAVDYLARFLCAGFALVLLATGCAGPRPLKGGKAITTRKPTGAIEQSIVQSDNPSQASKQTQETVKVRTYTLPTGSRLEQSQMPPPQPSTLNSQPSTFGPQPSTLSPQPSTTFLLSAPMPVIEREETRAGTELGAAQKDTARELGAKLACLKGIVWVGVGLFLFGLASLVYPPLKVIVASVTTSAALMFGGLALMVLPSLIVGNELLILSAVAIAIGGWFLAHRHGQLRGIVSASTGAQNNAPPSSAATPSVATPVSPQARS